MSLLNPEAAARLRALWNGRSIAPLSHATVREFCEYADVCPELFGGCQDLKDAQRPWAVKAILATVPPGSSLVEIGGGQPTVAQALTDLGYQVTVVDPYDGSGNGPVEYDRYLQDFPEVRLLRSLFTEDCPFRAASFDCAYSVSVIEHIPVEHLSGLFAAMRKFLKPGGASIHCIDMVPRGWMADFMQPGAREIIRLQHELTSQHALSGTDRFEKAAALMESDLETFFLSAHGHNVWRNGTPYEQYAFQRVASLQLCGKLPPPRVSWPRETLVCDLGHMVVTSHSDALQFEGRIISANGELPDDFQIVCGGRMMTRHDVQESQTAEGLPASRVTVPLDGLDLAQTCLVSLTPVFKGKPGWSFYHVIAPSLPQPDEPLANAVGGDFWAAGLDCLRLLVNAARLQPDHSVLDVGCGLGRVAYFLTSYLTSSARYQGFDVVGFLIDWAQKNLSPSFPNFTFRQVDLLNRMYNPDGRLSPETFIFPYANNSFEVVFLTSVFTHIFPPEIKHQLAEIQRVLKPGGRCLITCFLLDPESQELIAAGRSPFAIRHPHGECFVSDPAQPEFAVGLPEASFDEWCRDAGFRLVEKHPGFWCGRTGPSFQDVVVLESESQGPLPPENGTVVQPSLATVPATVLYLEQPDHLTDHTGVHVQGWIASSRPVYGVSVHGPSPIALLLMDRPDVRAAHPGHFYVRGFDGQCPGSLIRNAALEIVFEIEGQTLRHSFPISAPAEPAASSPLPTPISPTTRQPRKSIRTWLDQLEVLNGMLALRRPVSQQDLLNPLLVEAIRQIAQQVQSAAGSFQRNPARAMKINSKAQRALTLAGELQNLGWEKQRSWNESAIKAIAALGEAQKNFGATLLKSAGLPPEDLQKISTRLEEATRAHQKHRRGPARLLGNLLLDQRSVNTALIRALSQLEKIQSRLHKVI